MKIKSLEFNLRELAGSMGDGYIYACGLNPAVF
jgi:hypothetical protein